MLYMKMSFFIGIFVASPFVLYQIWAFIAPGLYAHERTWAAPFIIAGSLFFIGGAAFGHYYLFPSTFGFLGQFGGPDMRFMPRIGEYYSFYSWFILGLGIVFQIPVVIFILARIGIVTPKLPAQVVEVRRRGLLRRLGGHHADARRRDPVHAGGTHDRALRCSESWSRGSSAAPGGARRSRMRLAGQIEADLGPHQGPLATGLPGVHLDDERRLAHRLVDRARARPCTAERTRWR